MQSDFILGWGEWVALPGLGLPSIKAKVDTGASTSALHAEHIEPFGTAEVPMVRFVVRPVPGHEEIVVTCSCPVVGRRKVTSSNGEREDRFVIETRVRIGAREWPIEVTLTNRASMGYRMLLGRQAIREDVFVDPQSSFRQPRLSYKPYRKMPRSKPVKRAFRLAVLTRTPGAQSVARIKAAAAQHGHVLELLDLDRVALTFEGAEPGLAVAGFPVPHYDAIIPRVGEGGRPFAAQVVRQLELMGSFALNSGDALDRVRDRVSLVQALLRAGLPVSRSALSDKKAGLLRVLVVGDKAKAAAERHGNQLRKAEGKESAAARELAERAARILTLGLAAVDIGREKDELVIDKVSAVPALTRMEAVTGFDAADAIMAFIETRVRSWAAVPDASAKDLKTDPRL